MATNKSSSPEAKRAAPMFRPTEDDWVLLRRLRKKCGVNPTNVIRIAIRLLAEQKGIAA
jgi:hypothetical protein